MTEKRPVADKDDLVYMVSGTDENDDSTIFVTNSRQRAEGATAR